MSEFNKHVGPGPVVLENKYNIHVGPRPRPNFKGAIVSRETLDYIVKGLEEMGKMRENLFSAEFGDGEDIGVTQKTLTECRDNLQDQINAIVIDKAVVSLGVSPAAVFVGAESVITLTATSNTETSAIKIKKYGVAVASGSGVSLTGRNSVIPVSAGNINYTAEFTIAGLSKTASKSVAAVYPIRIGSGAAYVEGTALSAPKTSPAGTYNVAVGRDMDYVWFNVPATMTISKATMSGFNFPLEAAQAVEIDGVPYKAYRSSNTYDAGTLTIVIS